MLIKRFRLKDLRDLEFELEDMTVLDIFSSASLFGLIQLIKIGNNCDEETAGDILAKYLSQPGNTLVSAFEEVRSQIFQANDNAEQDPFMPKYSSLTDILLEYANQLLAMGISLGEFWDLDTYTLYKIASSISRKLAMETNMQLQLAHAQAALMGAAFAGKLPKDPPSVPVDKYSSDTIINYNGTEMTYEEFKTISAFMNLK